MKRLIKFLDGFVAGYVENRFAHVPVNERGALLHCLTHEVDEKYRSIIFPFSICTAISFSDTSLCSEEIENLATQHS